MTDDEYAARLLRPLDAEPQTPSQVDVARAVQDGRRRRRNRRTVRFGAGALVVAAAVGAIPAVVTASTGDREAGPVAASPTATEPADPSPSPSARTREAAPPVPARCTVSVLGLPAGVTMGLVGAMDPTGRFIVGRAYPNDSDRTIVLWDNGRMQAYDLPGSDQSARDVNSAGVVVGNTYLGEGSSPWYLRGGKVSSLSTLSGGAAEGINEAGVIVGSQEGSTGEVPVRWLSAVADPEELPIPAGVSGAAVGIDEDGTIAGNIEEGSRTKAVIWRPDGTMIELPAVKLDGAEAHIRAYDIRGGFVVGLAVAGDNDKDRTVRYDVTTGDVLVLPGDVGVMRAVNVHGWTAGGMRDGRPAFYADRTVPLPDVDHHGPYGVENLTDAISDDGRTLAGQGDDENGVIRPALWRCT